MKRRVIYSTLLLLCSGTLAAAAEGNDQERPELDDRKRYFPDTFVGPQMQATTVGEPAMDEEGKPISEIEAEAKDSLPIETTLLPGRRSRFFRSLKMSISYLDQADCLEDKGPLEGETGLCAIIEDTVGNPPADRIFRINPDDHLFSYEGTLSPGRWILSTDDFTKAYALAAVLPDSYVNTNGDPIRAVPAGEKLDRLVLGFGKRLALATSLTVKYPERKKVSAEGARLPDPILSENRFEPTISFEFDPSRLLVYAGDLAAAYKALDGHTKLRKDNLSGLDVGECRTDKGAVDCVAKVCGGIGGRSDILDCLELLSDKKVRPRWTAAAIPKLKYEQKEQFDFLRDGAGAFESRPFVDDRIETLTLTWDLGTVLDTANHRREALTAITAHQSLVQQDHMRELGAKPLKIATVAAKVGDGDTISEPLFATYDGGKFVDATWSAVWVKSEDDKRAIAEIGLHLNPKPGVLLGRPKKDGSPHLLEVTAKDSYGHSATTTYEVRVE